ncbi:hypothetical protein AB0B50_25800 [Streptomyces sp. NPDC041068]|uniref:hypothetical protein n=1 Tax=Streptomyces sp. NPDC041068 TaxID=3155130 RepID=UPI0033E5C6B9
MATVSALCARNSDRRRFGQGAVANTRFGEGGLVRQLARNLLESPSKSELADRLGHESGERADQVGIFGPALGRDLRFEPAPVGLPVSMLADGRSEKLVDALLAASTRRPESRLVADDGERPTGAPARPLAEWVGDQSIRPCVSASACTARRSISHVPSADQRRCRS